MEMDTLVKDHLHSQAKINATPCDEMGIEQLIATFSESEEAYLQKTAKFLIEWFSPQEFLSLHTSGTTGTPKQITVRKEHMIHSAMLTGAFLQLQAGDRALCVLPTDYIAGKMMLVRALVLGLSLELFPPSGTPFAATSDNFDFSCYGSPIAGDTHRDICHLWNDRDSFPYCLAPYSPQSAT